MIFFIYGTDHYRCQEKLAEVKNQFIEKRDQSGLNVITLDGQEIDFEQFRQEALTVPFLGEKKMIVIRNILENKKRHSAITEFLKEKENALDNILVFIDLFSPEKKTTPTGALFEYLKKQKYLWQFNLLKSREIKTWLDEYAANNQIVLEAKAGEILSAMVGSDLTQMVLELKKLAAYKNGEQIKKEDVDLLVKAKVDENIFDLVDALGQKNKKSALKLLANQLAGGNHPLMILTMVSRQFKNILKAKENPSGRGSGLHPFVFQKALGQSRNFTNESLAKIYHELMAIESQLKSGAKNPELILDMFILNHC